MYSVKVKCRTLCRYLRWVRSYYHLLVRQDGASRPPHTGILRNGKGVSIVVLSDTLRSGNRLLDSKMIHILLLHNGRNFGIESIKMCKYTQVPCLY